MERVSVPFVVRPDLERSTAPLRSGAPDERVRRLKRAEFDGPLRSELLGERPGCEAGILLLAEALGLDAGAYGHGGLNEPLHGRSAILQAAHGRGGATLGAAHGHGAVTLEALALDCREDLALLRNGVLEAIAFAFPSGFRPTEKLGQDFARVHAPVAEGEALRAASAGITAAMKRPGARFERGVWTLTSLPTLSQHPDYERPTVRGEADLFFRSEFQVLCALGEGWTGFSVRVEMTPWPELSEAQQTRVKASLASMSEASRSYKNLHEIAALLGV